MDETIPGLLLLLLLLSGACVPEHRQAMLEMPTNGICHYGNRVDCCWGWKRESWGQCRPVCELGCKHGECVGPDQCRCHHGYTGKTCNQDVNECGLKPRPCKHRCMNTVGSYKCFCLTGYMMTHDGTCRNARTCAMANCQYGCAVMKGEVMCQCPSPGLRLGPDRRTCVDIDECAMGVAKCPRFRKCVNTFGSYICKCHKGFELRYVNGKYQCTDKSNPCHEKPDSKQCRCKPGTRGWSYDCKFVMTVTVDPARPFTTPRPTTKITTSPFTSTTKTPTTITTKTTTSPTTTTTTTTLPPTTSIITTTTTLPPTTTATSTSPPTTIRTTTLSPTTTIITTTNTSPTTFSPTTTIITTTTTSPITTTTMTTPTTVPPLTTPAITKAATTVSTSTAPSTVVMTTAAPTTVASITPTIVATTAPTTVSVVTTAMATTVIMPTTTTRATTPALLTTVQLITTTLDNHIQEITQRPRGDVHIPRNPEQNVFELDFDDIELGNTADFARDDPAAGYFSCSFDQGLCSWMTDQDGDLRWETVPDPNGGQYLTVTEPKTGRSSKGARLTISLVPPTTPPWKGGNLCLAFRHRLQGLLIGSLQVFVKKRWGHSPAVWTRTSGQGWRHTHITLWGQGIESVVVKGERRKGRSGEIAIDDVSMHRGACSNRGRD